MPETPPPPRQPRSVKVQPVKARGRRPLSSLTGLAGRAIDRLTEVKQTRWEPHSVFLLILVRSSRYPTIQSVLPSHQQRDNRVTTTGIPPVHVVVIRVVAVIIHFETLF